MDLRLKKGSYCVVVLLTAILSTKTVHSATQTSMMFWTEQESSFPRNLITDTYTGIKLPEEIADAYTCIHIYISTLLHLQEQNSPPLIVSVPPEGYNISDNISGEKVNPVPEPLTLLLLGSGLISIALYRKFKK